MEKSSVFTKDIFFVFALKNVRILGKYEFVQEQVKFGRFLENKIGKIMHVWSKFCLRLGKAFVILRKFFNTFGKNFCRFRQAQRGV